MERKWKLGEDLYPEDNLLDGLSIANLILALHHESTVDRKIAEKCLKDILDSRLEDMWFIFKNNIDEIIKKAMEGREQ